MATQHHIRNPFEIGVEQLSSVFAGAPRARPRPTATRAAPAVRRIATADLFEALRRGAADLGAARADVLFIGVIYPLAGLVLMWAAFNYALLPLLFPLVSGFALVGPLAALGLYEISRRREQGEPATWTSGFGVLRAPNLGSILGLGSILLVLFAAWLAAAWAIYALTLGPAPPTSVGGFLRDVFTTSGGWTMTAVGIGVGFLFALLAFSISVVSFPLLLDREDVGLGEAIATSFRAVMANPAPMAVWGAIVAGALVLGSLPALVGLIVIMPLLGHASWHLYRRTVEA